MWFHTERCGVSSRSVTVSNTTHRRVPGTTGRVARGPPPCPPLRSRHGAPLASSEPACSVCRRFYYQDQTESGGDRRRRFHGSQCVRSKPRLLSPRPCGEADGDTRGKGRTMDGGRAKLPWPWQLRPAAPATVRWPHRLKLIPEGGSSQEAS